MISKINSIKNFGVFNNYKAPTDLAAFNKINLIYGWNYSGKTTLSRLFSSIRDKTIHPSLKGSEFSIALSDKNVINQKNIAANSHLVHVFNSEYCRENLDWERNENVAGITFDVGETIDIRKKIKYNLDVIDSINGNDKIKGRKDPLIASVKSFDTLVKSFPSVAKHIKNEVFNSLIEFDKRHFDSVLKSIEYDIQSHIIIDESELSKIRKTALAMNNKDSLPEIKYESDAENITKGVNAILTYIPGKNNIIDILEENYEIANWARRGLELLENYSTCAFCGNSLTEERISKLMDYFNNESSNLRGKINVLKSRIGEEIIRLDSLGLPASKNDLVD